MRIGAIGYATTQGLGRLMKSFYDAGLVREVMIFRHTHKDRVTHTEWYPFGTTVLTSVPFRGSHVDQFLSKIDVLLTFETPFDWSIYDLCRKRNIKTVLMPMYEWCPTRFRFKPDLMLCPSLLDKDYFPDGVYLPVPVETKFWKLRTHARRFLHNAGNVGCKEHKGTRQLLEAVQYVKNPNFRLTVRAQDVRCLKSIVHDHSYVERDKRVSIEYGEIPYEQLWDGHDVLIAPEKLNGLSLPLQEGYAAGMMVMTTDRYPTNTWLPKEPLIPVERYEKARQSGGCLEFDLAIVEPRTIAKVIDEWIGRDITDFSMGAKEWSEANSWHSLKPEYFDVFGNLMDGRIENGL